MPNLTTKELAMLGDVLNGEKQEIAGFTTMSEKCCDPQLKSKLAAIASRHQMHYDTLYKFL